MLPNLVCGPVMLSGKSPLTYCVKNVALLIETSNTYARGLLRGIVSSMRERPNWSIHLAPDSSTSSI
jgi:hypothetical protein